MQTTLRIRDDLYREAKAEAAREGMTLTSFLESAIRLRLGRSEAGATGKPHPFPVHTPEERLPFSNDEIRRVAEEEEFNYDVRKLEGGKR